MQTLPPPIITALRACHLIVPEGNPALPFKILFVLALAWTLLGPAVVFVGVRNRHPTRGVVVYLLGAVVATAVIVALSQGWTSSCGPTQRLALLFGHLGLPLLGCGGVIALLASVLGRLTRQRVIDNQT